MGELTIPTTAELAALKELFQGSDNKDLTQGVAPSFPVISFRGKVWRVMAGGEEKIVQNADGDPVASMKFVIVKASPNVSKLFYEKKYAEGDDNPPDCYSTDGVKPDPDAPKKQSPSCASCPMNQFGSRITEDGKKAKACTDNRRVAVIQYPRVDHNLGPALLRVPPTSLGNLMKLGSALEKAGVPYQAVAVKVGFDQSVSYPKLTFTPTDVLTPEQAKVVRDWMNDDVMDGIFATPVHDPSTEDAKPAEVQEREVQGRGISDTPEDRKPVDEAPKASKAEDEAPAEDASKRQRAAVADDVADETEQRLDDVLGALS